MSSAFGHLLQSIGNMPALVAEIGRATYIELLLAHDWSRSDRESLAQLRMLQREVDPSGEIWRSHCPAGHEVPR